MRGLPALEESPQTLFKIKTLAPLLTCESLATCTLLNRETSTSSKYRSYPYNPPILNNPFHFPFSFALIENLGRERA